ncbi:HAD-IB family hydrolase [Pseudomonas sp. Marseille-Q8238]
MNAAIPPEGGLKPLSIFDFDGTLTWRDSFVPFLRFAFGNYRFGVKLTRTGSSSVHYLYGGMTRDKMKAKLIRNFLGGVDPAWVAEQAQVFCDRNWERMMRPSGLIGLRAEQAEGRTVSLCSASPALLLKPFAERLGVELIATELEIVDGKLTGHILGRNCRRDEKVNRLVQRFGPLQHCHLRAWGNSSGDTELLGAAQEAHYRVFRD